MKNAFWMSVIIYLQNRKYFPREKIFFPFSVRYFCNSYRRCGMTIGDVVIPGNMNSGQKLEIIFQTDDDIEEHGFQIEYRPTGDSAFQHFTDDSGTLKTPNFDTGIRFSNNQN